MNIFLSGSSLRIAAIVAFAAIVFSVDAQQVTIPIETKNNALILQVSSENYVNMVYFGKKLADKKEYDLLNKVYRESHNTSGYNSAYPSAGARNLLEPAIAV